METTSEPAVWRIVDLIQWGSEYFTKNRIQQPRLSMELIIGKILEIKRLDLYLQFDRPLDAGQLAKVKELVQKRVKHVPIQYLLGQWDFYGLPFSVSEHVLIPRPETEILVESVLKALKKDGINASTYGLDLGTGSGNIAIAMMAQLPESRCIAVDISLEALGQARLNAEKNGVSEKIEFRQGDWFEALGATSEARLLDWIVSNPPYIASGEWASLPDEVRLYEPKLALLAGEKGLDCLEAIVAGAAMRLKAGGWLALEIGEGQAPAVRALLDSSGAFGFSEAVKDNNGTDRIILAKAV